MYVPKTKNFDCKIGTFKMLPGVPFKANLLNKIINANEAEDTEMASVFRVLEGYMYEFLPNGDSDISVYVTERAGLGLQARFVLLGDVINYHNFDNIMDAYLTTRDDAAKEADDLSEDQKDAKKNESKTQSEKQLTPQTES